MNILPSFWDLSTNISEIFDGHAAMNIYLIHTHIVLHVTYITDSEIEVESLSYLFIQRTYWIRDFLILINILLIL